jgi:hypothetical protein
MHQYKEKQDELWANAHLWYPCIYVQCVENQPSRQTGSRNLTGPKILPTILRTKMKIAMKYQISAINSCWEKCDEKLAYICSMCIKTKSANRK